MRPEWMKMPIDTRFGTRKPGGPDVPASRMAQVAGDGFAEGRVWFHGSARRISKFRRGVRDAELGPGIYLADQWDRGRSWAGPDGHVMSCLLRDGDFADLSAFDRDDVIAELHRRHVARMVTKWGPGASGETVEDFRDRLQGVRRSRTVLNRALAAMGFVGAYDHRSQIIGQVVIFDPQDIRVICAVRGNWERAEIQMEQTDDADEAISSISIPAI